MILLNVISTFVAFPAKSITAFVSPLEPFAEILPTIMLFLITTFEVFPENAITLDPFNSNPLTVNPTTPSATVMLPLITASGFLVPETALISAFGPTKVILFLSIVICSLYVPETTVIVEPSVAYFNASEIVANC